MHNVYYVVDECHEARKKLQEQQLPALTRIVGRQIDGDINEIDILLRDAEKKFQAERQSKLDRLRQQINSGQFDF